MRIIKCDRCGKEINGKTELGGIEVEIEYNNHTVYEDYCKDYCKECFDVVSAVIISALTKIL